MCARLPAGQLLDLLGSKAFRPAGSTVFRRALLLLLLLMPLPLLLLRLRLLLLLLLLLYYAGQSSDTERLTSTRGYDISNSRGREGTAMLD